MTKKKKEVLDPATALYANVERFKMHQKGLFRWSLIGLALFLISWNADTISEIMGMNVQKNDPLHDLFYFFPVLLGWMISIIIALCTGGLTLFYWHRLINKPRKITTICSASIILLFATYVLLQIILE
jgi:hypothetical protein